MTELSHKERKIRDQFDSIAKIDCKLASLYRLRSSRISKITIAKSRRRTKHMACGVTSVVSDNTTVAGDSEVQLLTALSKSTKKGS